MALKEMYCVVWFLLTFGACSLIISLCTSHWSVNGDYHAGLFERCIPKMPGCYFLQFFKDGTPGAIEASRILILGACALLLVSNFLSYASMCIKLNVSTAISILNLISLLLITCGMSTYTHHTRHLAHGYSFALGWASACSLAVGLILLLVTFIFTEPEEGSEDSVPAV